MADEMTQQEHSNIKCYVLNFRYIQINQNGFILQHNCKDVRVNIEDKILMKMFNPILKMRETILFFLIVMINRLI